LRLTVNGHELDLLTFVEHWQNQVSTMIEEEATKAITKKFRDVDEILEEY